MDKPSDSERKIIVDEDWKSQVEREKAKLRPDAESDPVPPTASDGSASDRNLSSNAPPNDPSSGVEDPVLPPPNFTMLVALVANQAYQFLGLIPDAEQNRAVTRPNAAKHQIDLLEMLEQKTKGNLDRDEAAALGSILHQLRLMYLNVKR